MLDPINCNNPKCKTKFVPRRKSNKFCCRKCARAVRTYFGHDKVNWSEVNKKSYADGRNYVAGGTSKWLNYKDIKVQGTWELRTCKILDKLAEQKEIYDWEYTNDRIQYIGEDGKPHSYLLDFKVFLNNTFYYLEVKGRKSNNDELKWKAVRNKNIELII